MEIATERIYQVVHHLIVIMHQPFSGHPCLLIQKVVMNIEFKDNETRKDSDRDRKRKKEQQQYRCIKSIFLTI